MLAPGGAMKVFVATRPVDFRKGIDGLALAVQEIRPIALTRKNALFAGNEVGAENWAMLASLVATCKMAGVNPVDYLAATLRAILDGHPKNRIEELMPWHFEQPSSLAA